MLTIKLGSLIVLIGLALGFIGTIDLLNSSRVINDSNFAVGSPGNWEDITLTELDYNLFKRGLWFLSIGLLLQVIGLIVGENSEKKFLFSINS